MGRRAELDLLRGARADAEGGRPSFVAVEGEGGIGKTALLERFLAEQPDLPVARASGEESETVLEHGVVCQLRSALADPALTGARWPVTVDADSFAVGADLVGELGLLQEQGTVVLVIDDVQWMDPASARALLFAFRRFRQDHILIIVAGRPGASETFGDSWSRFMAEHARLVRMAGLDTGELRLLARDSARLNLSPGAGERLRDHTGGNPLYVRALLDELPEGVLVDAGAPCPRRTPTRPRS